MKVTEIFDVSESDKSPIISKDPDSEVFFTEDGKTISKVRPKIQVPSSNEKWLAYGPHNNPSLRGGQGIELMRN